MTADLPPIPQCVLNIADVKTQSIVIDGKNEDVRSFLDNDQVKKGVFEISLSQVNEEGNVTAIFRFGINTPYRELGGLIYTAQMAGLNIGGWTYQPPLCKPGDRLP